MAAWSVFVLAIAFQTADSSASTQLLKISAKLLLPTPYTLTDMLGLKWPPHTYLLSYSGILICQQFYVSTVIYGFSLSMKGPARWLGR